MSNNSLLKKTLLSTAILSISLQASAEGGAIKSLTGFDINETSFMKESGFEVGLWVSSGVSGNSNGNTNTPVTFNNRVNEFMLNQLNFYIERAVNTEGNSWDIGGRMDIMYGNDTQFTTASGWDDTWGSAGTYGVAMPQLYLEIYAPIGNGLTAKLGHFYTTIGNEVVTSPDNFFYSHAYTMQYGEPFTHTGVLLSYKINDNFSINGGAVEGWDNMTSNAGAWSFLGGGSWTSDDEASSVTVQLISGNQSDTQPGNTTMYSVVATHDFNDKLHYLFQHDFGTKKAPNGTTADWYGINQYLTYDVNDQVAIGVRAEWFNDNGGAQRVNAAGIGANYLAASFGINYAPVNWFKLRPEIRYDWADANVFNNNRDKDQIGIAMDMVFTF